MEKKVRKITRDNESNVRDKRDNLEKIDSRLRIFQGGITKKDLVTLLSIAKEDSIARLITSGNNPQSEEEADVALNPPIRHIAPHLQALTVSELVHLLKADVYYKQP